MIEFKTSKGEFVVHNLPCNDAELLGRRIDDFYWSFSSKSVGWGKFPMRGNYRLICKLSEATEEDAIKVVSNSFTNLGNKPSNIEILHSLLKSKGIDINNGNWYLFKKIKMI